MAKQSERQWQERLEGQLLDDIMKLRKKWERHFDQTTIPDKFLQFVDAILRGISTERVDYSTGGSIDGMIAASDANLPAATENTIIIPGHGKPVSNKSELKAFRDMLVDIRDKIAGLKKSGRTLEETVAAKPTAAHDTKWGQFVIDPPFFTKLVYEGV